MFHAVKDANVAKLIKVDLKYEEFSFMVDEERHSYLELLDGKLLRVTNTDALAQDLVAHYKMPGRHRARLKGAQIGH